MHEQQGKKPLYIQLALPSPHKPYQAPVKYLAMHEFQTAEKPERRSYQATLAATDDSIARLVAEVDKMGLAGDTVYVFLSDNGGDSKGMANNTPLRDRRDRIRRSACTTVPCACRRRSRGRA
jgi:arylsulfatase A-like enzyme